MPSPEEVLAAYDAGEVDLHAKVNVRMPAPTLKTRFCLNDLVWFSGDSFADWVLILVSESEALVLLTAAHFANGKWLDVGEVPVLGGDGSRLT